MQNKAVASHVEVKKALGFKGDLDSIEMTVEGKVLYTVSIPNADFLKAMGISGTLSEIVDGDDSVIINSANDVATSTKRGPKAKPQTSPTTAS